MSITVTAPGEEWFLRQAKYPVQPGYAVKWERYKIWRDDNTDTVKVKYSIRLTERAIPGVQEVLFPKINVVVYERIDAAQSRNTGEVINYVTRGLICDWENIQNLFDRVKAGDVPCV